MKHAAPVWLHPELAGALAIVLSQPVKALLAPAAMQHELSVTSMKCAQSQQRRCSIPAFPLAP